MARCGPDGRRLRRTAERVIARASAPMPVAVGTAGRDPLDPSDHRTARDTGPTGPGCFSDSGGSWRRCKEGERLAPTSKILIVAVNVGATTCRWPARGISRHLAASRGTSTALLGARQPRHTDTIGSSMPDATRCSCGSARPRYHFAADDQVQGALCALDSSSVHRTDGACPP